MASPHDGVAHRMEEMGRAKQVFVLSSYQQLKTFILKALAWMYSNVSYIVLGVLRELTKGSQDERSCFDYLTFIYYSTRHSCHASHIY